MEQKQTPDQNQPSDQATPAPDFSFIVNQPEAPVGHKKRSKKIIIIVVLLVLLIAVSLLAVLMPKKEQPAANGTTQNNTDGSAQLAPVEESAARNITEQFLGQITAGNVEIAHSMLDPASNISSDTFTNGSAKFLRDYIQTDKCTTTVFENGNDVKVECPAKNNDKTAHLVFSIIEEQDKIYIARYQLLEVK